MEPIDISKEQHKTTGMGHTLKIKLILKLTVSVPCNSHQEIPNLISVRDLCSKRI